MAYKLASISYYEKLKVIRKSQLINRINSASNSTKELFKVLNEFMRPTACISAIPASQEFCNVLACHVEEKMEYTGTSLTSPHPLALCPPFPHSQFLHHLGTP